MAQKCNAYWRDLGNTSRLSQNEDPVPYDLPPSHRTIPWKQLEGFMPQTPASH